MPSLKEIACISGRCYSPIACNGFGYCREKNFAEADTQLASTALLRRRPRGECSYCDQYGDDPMMPRHTASDRCESGKRPHCTCDICF